MAGWGYRRAFEQILEIFIVVVIQAANRDALPIALEFAAHIAVSLSTVVSLDRETTVGPQLALVRKRSGVCSKATSKA